MASAKLLNIAVGALIKDNHILLIKRNKPPFAGLWSLPGGKIETGEQIEGCAVREFEEETGIKTSFRGLKGIVNEVLYHEKQIEGHFIIFVCELEKNRGEIKESDEGELEWFDIKKLEESKNTITGSDLEMIKQMILSKGNDLNIHRSVMRKDGESYMLESFGK
ncbi:MAG: NUDIX domain-containing protein [Candidatus Woesearchaeota archaeon]